MDILLAIIKGVFLVGAVLMIFLILLQEGKGGGLAALGGTRAAGVEGVTNPIRRATAYLAVVFFFLAIMIGWLSKPPKAVGVAPLEETAPARGGSAVGAAIPAGKQPGKEGGAFAGSQSEKKEAERKEPEKKEPEKKETKEAEKKEPESKEPARKE